MSRAAETNRRDRSIDAHRARRRAPARSIARPPASRAPAISPGAAAARFPATCSAGDRTGLRSFFVVIRDQPLQQANAKARAPALIDLGFRRPHRRSRDIEMRPWRAVDETLQELGGGDRAAMAAAGVLHVGKLRIDLLVVFGRERHPPEPLAGVQPSL